MKIGYYVNRSIFVFLLSCIPLYSSQQEKEIPMLKYFSSAQAIKQKLEKDFPPLSSVSSENIASVNAPIAPYCAYMRAAFNTYNEIVYDIVESLIQSNSICPELREFAYASYASKYLFAWKTPLTIKDLERVYILMEMAREKLITLTFSLKKNEIFLFEWCSDHPICCTDYFQLKNELNRLTYLTFGSDWKRIPSIAYRLKKSISFVTHGKKTNDPSFFLYLPVYKGLVHLSCTRCHLTTMEINILKKLPTLQEINMSHNKISIIPSTMSKLMSLQFLNLSNNAIECIPDEITHLSLLKGLNVSNNHINNMPESVSNLISLHTLNIANNSDIKMLPGDLAHLTTLASLYIEETGIKKIHQALIPLHCVVRVSKEIYLKAKNKGERIDNIYYYDGSYS